MFRFPWMLLLAVLATGARAEDPPATSQPNYHELSPSLIANLPTGARYVRCDVQLMTMDAGQLEDIQLHAPAIRHALLMLLSEQDGAKLNTPEGKEALRQEALRLTRATLQELTGRVGVEDLFFTAFFVQ